MSLYFACTTELISCMKGLCNIPVEQVGSNSVALSPGAVEKDKGLTEAFWFGVVAFEIEAETEESELSPVSHLKSSTWGGALWGNE